MSLARIRCLFLAACLFLCGCGAQSDLPPSSGAVAKVMERMSGMPEPTDAPEPTVVPELADAPEPTGTPEPAESKTPKQKKTTRAPAEVEPWRTAYAKVAIDSLGFDPRMRASSISLLYCDGALPLLVMIYAYDDAENDWRRLQRAWKIERDEAVLVYEGYDSVEGVRVGTGNPVIFTYRSEEDTFYDHYAEHCAGEITPLVEFAYGFYGEDATYSSLIDGRTWSAQSDPHGEWLSDFFSRQRELLPLMFEYGAQEHAYEDFDPTEKIRDFLGVSGWSPDVPAGAPPWVAEYVSLLHNHLFFSYDPDRPADLAEEGLNAGDWGERWTGVTLMEPPEPGMAPLLRGDLVEPFGFVGETTVIPLKNRNLVVGDGPDDGYEFYKDAQGGYIIRKWTYTHSLWMTIGENDLEPLFRSGHGYVGEGQAAYLNDAYVEFASADTQAEEQAIAWEGERVEAKLVDLGYTELSAWPQVSIHLPATATWREIESILTKEFCSYAKRIGQM